MTTRSKGRRSFTLSTQTMRQLRSALEGADFPMLRSRYQASTPIPDSFQFSITYKGRTVNVDETEAPSALDSAVEVLNEVIAKRSP